MTDPIAEAAAQQAAAQNQSTTTPYPNAAGGASPEGTSSQEGSAPAVSVLGAGETPIATGEQGNVAQAAAPASAASDSLPNSVPAAGEQEAQAGGAEDPNAGAQSAENGLESVITSSVSAVSHAVGTLEASASEDRKRARVAIDHLRAHLWTFTGDAVANLHAELDKLEAFFK